MGFITRFRLSPTSDLLPAALQARRPCVRWWANAGATFGDSVSKAACRQCSSCSHAHNWFSYMWHAPWQASVHKVDQNFLNQPPLWETTQELITRISNTRRWHEAAMRAIVLLSDSLSQQLW